MNVDAHEAALAAYPELQRLKDIREVGWIFQVISPGDVVQIKGMYIWTTADLSTWGDMIQIRNIDDAAAVRLNPLKELVWKYEGDMVGAIDALLELPAPDEPNAPRLVIGRLHGLWTP